MSKPERVLSYVLALFGVLQMLALVPSVPFIYYAGINGPSAMWRGDFGYWAVRDSILAAISLLLVISSIGSILIVFRVVRSRAVRRLLWAASAVVYLLYPAAQALDPRAVSFPPGDAAVLLSYLLFVSLLSSAAFYFACQNTQTQSS